MTEAHDLVFAREHFQHACGRFFGRAEFLDQFHRRFVGAAVQRPAQRTDSAGYRGMEIRQGARDHTRCKCGRVELVLRVKYECGVECFPVQLAWRLVMQHVQEVGGHAVVVCFHIDALAVAVEAVPVQQHGWQTGEQPVGHLALVGKFAFRLDIAENRHSAAQYVHRMGIARYHFQHLPELLRQAAQRFQFGNIAIKLRLIRQLIVHQQVGNFFETRVVGEIVNIVAAVGQTCTFLAYRT